MKLLATLLLLCSAFTADAQALKPVNPEKAGFDRDRLARIDSMMASYTSDHRVAGTAAIILRHGKVVYHTASGYRDIEAGDQLKKDDIFRIASQTKAITCAAVMMLHEEGKFMLEDPISKYIPEFRKPQVLKTFDKTDSSYTAEPASREITIRDLLTHTSGISYAVIGEANHNAIYAKAGVPIGFEPRPIKLADKMKILGGLPLMHNPGEKFTYGLSIDVLGYLVEVISGQSLADFFRVRIFEPLGMKDTFFYVPEEKHARVISMYTNNDQGQAIPRPQDTLLDHSYPLVKNGSYYSGGAGLSSTVYDYAIFFQMLSNGGVFNGKRVMSPYAARMIASDQKPDKVAWGVNTTIGFGGEVITEKGSLTSPLRAGSFSTGGFWGTGGWMDPESGIVVVLMGQHSTWTWSEFYNKFRVMVYGALMEAQDFNHKQ